MSDRCSCVDGPNYRRGAGRSTNPTFAEAIDAAQQLAKETNHGDT